MIQYDILKQLHNKEFPGITSWTYHNYKTTEQYKDGKFIGDLYKCKCGKTHLCSQGLATSSRCSHTTEFNRDCPKGEVKYSSPTLSELIEACGDIEFILHCYPKRYNNDITDEPWFVIERINLIDMERCSTPEEAVAKLWLSIYKNDNKRN